MTYFSLFHLKEEPFSNSPDPTFFYQAPRHTRCLHKLEIAIRLKRGLNVVLGDVGTGKTTLCRRLIRTLQADERIDAHLLLDPQFDTPREFLAVLCRTLCPTGFEFEDTEWRLKERVKNALFRHGVDQGRVVALIIDEGQKIREDCMEVLRELLNYETNNAKLLQIIIFAQLEFKALIDKHANLADRINELLALGPLNRRETRDMIRHRVEQAKDTFLAPELFTPAAYAEVHKVTGGYPRKIMRVSHKALLALAGAGNGQGKITPKMVRESAKDIAPPPRRPMKWGAVAALATSLLLVAGGVALVALPGLWNQSVTTVRQALFHDHAQADEPDAGLARVQIAGSAESGRWFPELEVADALALVQSEPELLGSVILDQDGSLTQLAQRIYGPAAGRALPAFRRANPHIMNPDRVAAGTHVRVPSVGPVTPEELADSFVVHVATRENLESALAAADQLTAMGVEAGILPVRGANDQLMFAVVALRRCGDESSAHEVLADLPEDWREGARIVRGWDSGALLLAQAGPHPSP